MAINAKPGRFCEGDYVNRVVGELQSFEAFCKSIRDEVERDTGIRIKSTEAMFLQGSKKEELHKISYWATSHGDPELLEKLGDEFLTNIGFSNERALQGLPLDMLIAHELGVLDKDALEKLYEGAFATVPVAAPFTQAQARLNKSLSLENQINVAELAGIHIALAGKFHIATESGIALPESVITRVPVRLKDGTYSTTEKRELELPFLEYLQLRVNSMGLTSIPRFLNYLASLERPIGFGEFDVDKVTGSKKLIVGPSRVISSSDFEAGSEEADSLIDSWEAKEQTVHNPEFISPEMFRGNYKGGKILEKRVKEAVVKAINPTFAGDKYNRVEVEVIGAYYLSAEDCKTVGLKIVPSDFLRGQVALSDKTIKFEDGQTASFEIKIDQSKTKDRKFRKRLTGARTVMTHILKRERLEQGIQDKNEVDIDSDFKVVYINGKPVDGFFETFPIVRDGWEGEEVGTLIDPEGQITLQQTTLTLLYKIQKDERNKFTYFPREKDLPQIVRRSSIGGTGFGSGQGEVSGMYGQDSAIASATEESAYFSFPVIVPKKQVNKLVLVKKDEDLLQLQDIIGLGTGESEKPIEDVFVGSPVTDSGIVIAKTHLTWPSYLPKSTQDAKTFRNVRLKRFDPHLKGDPSRLSRIMDSWLVDDNSDEYGYRPSPVGRIYFEVMKYARDAVLVNQ